MPTSPVFYQHFQHFNVCLRGRAGYVRDRTKLIPIEPTKALLTTCETQPSLITRGLFRVLAKPRTRLFGPTGTSEADSNFSINQLLGQVQTVGLEGYSYRCSNPASACTGKAEEIKSRMRGTPYIRCVEV